MTEPTFPYQQVYVNTAPNGDPHCILQTVYRNNEAPAMNSGISPPYSKLLCIIRVLFIILWSFCAFTFPLVAELADDLLDLAIYLCGIVFGLLPWMVLDRSCCTRCKPTSENAVVSSSEPTFSQQPFHSVTAANSEYAFRLVFFIIWVMGLMVFGFLFEYFSFFGFNAVFLFAFGVSFGVVPKAVIKMCCTVRPPQNMEQNQPNLTMVYVSKVAVASVSTQTDTDAVGDNETKIDFQNEDDLEKEKLSDWLPNDSAPPPYKITETDSV